MRRVFFLTYLFPPVGGIGSLRATKLARYLPEFGWMPTIFHAGKGNNYLRDESLLAEVPSEVRRIPVRSFEGAPLLNGLRRAGLGFLSYRLPLLLPLDGQVGWVPGLIQAVQREVEQSGPPDAMFSSSAPYSITVAGLTLRNRLKRPWIADFRDDWTQHPHIRFLTPAHRAIAQYVEQQTLNRADAITTVTEPWAEAYQARRPASMRAVDLVPNGYDENDFSFPLPEKPTDKWTLAFIGTAYRMTDPSPILEVLAEAIQDGAIPGDKVRVVHLGNGRIKWPGGSFETQDLGFGSHHEALVWMLRAHALLFACQRPEASSGRIYEYMRAGVPIVGMAPHGEASTLVEQSGRGHIFDPHQKAELRAYLVDLYSAWRENPAAAPLPCTPDIATYSRREQARRLAGILDDLAG